ncbi:hypothetical protein MBCUT_19630 [Methanobrevibacter cuticularis]|uniref:DUF2178 domain-containing protein n=1 Tax=Methanobrevibacter cuticularis TaxID=47311 RepID=A0A166CPA5_9EURY|nr:DUF2178 domain-containing protein [Methanobrevibacter cuticularis]KZX14721.1 hypothetical protein MBCUT_19630 [Methanobrevibacter cuticularis]
MNTKIKVIIAVILSSIISLLWIIGLIIADINLFIIAIILLLITIPFAYKNFDELKEFFRTRKGEVVEDEREEYIQEQAGYMAFGLSIALNIYIAVAIITLRNLYPQYSPIAYVLIIITLISFIIFTIGKYYYKNKY